MINQFPTSLDNNPSAPGDWAWPSFVARTPSEAERVWRDALLGQLPTREGRFRSALILDGLVRSSCLQGERVRVDPRITYTAQDVAARVGQYGYQVLFTGGSGSPAILRPTYQPTHPLAWAATVLATSSSQLTVSFDSGGSVTQGVTFSGGSTAPFPLVGDSSITGILQGTAMLPGDQWRFTSYDVGAGVIERGIASMRSLGTPGWLPADLLANLQTLRESREQLAAIVCGFAR
jgi:hypothetical protein